MYAQQHLFSPFLVYIPTFNNIYLFFVQTDDEWERNGIATCLLSRSSEHKHENSNWRSQGIALRQFTKT
jgi:hypothetical protein